MATTRKTTTVTKTKTEPLLDTEAASAGAEKLFGKVLEKHSIDLSKTFDEMLDALRQAQSEYEALRKQSQELRKQWMEEVAMKVIDASKIQQLPQEQRRVSESLDGK